MFVCGYFDLFWMLWIFWVFSDMALDIIFTVSLADVFKNSYLLLKENFRRSTESNCDRMIIQVSGKM